MFLKYILPKCLMPYSIWRHSNRLCHSIPNKFFQVTKEVQECLQVGNPIVALESTIITHGMPYPQNLETALKVENIVRNNNATPATVGVIDGKIYVGMDKDMLERLASKHKECIKISKRDLPFALSMKMSGGTTVAATMSLAHAAGIELFVTGGIGGVHRDGENSMDVSADLIELSNTPMTVVSAGIKSILDIGRTLEFLETYGVSVATYGKSKEFPAFFIPTSGHFAPYNISTALNAAHLIMSRNDLRLKSAILIAVPIPLDCAADGMQTENAIKNALEEARLKNVLGKDVTPFILSRVQELSSGASLRANIALIENNAKVGSQIAVELAKIKAQRQKNNTTSSSNNTIFNITKTSNLSSAASNEYVKKEDSRQVVKQKRLCPRPVVIGGSVLDVTVISHQQDIQRDGGTYPGEVEISAGGVGRNIADCLGRLNMNPFLISAIGSDENGAMILNKIKHIDINGIDTVKNARSGVFGVFLNQSRECLSCIGNMKIHDYISIDQVKAHKDILLQAPLVAMDGNIPLETMQYMFSLCAEHKIPVWFEPTDINKAAKPFMCDHWKDSIVFISPNILELRVIYSAIYGTTSTLKGVNTENPKMEDIIKECMHLGPKLAIYIPNIIVTLGKYGSIVFSLCSKNESFLMNQNSEDKRFNQVHAVHYLAPKPSQIKSVSGAGDCFASAVMAAIIRGYSQDDCIKAGQAAAVLSLSSNDAVPGLVNEENVFNPKDMIFETPRNIKIS